MNRTFNILIVDDVEFSRDILRNSILACINDGNLPLVPNFFHTGNDRNIFEIIDFRGINIVFLDINLAEENGLVLLKSIKQRLTEVTVVMVSAEGSSENVMEAIKYGANGFIVKPYNIARINESLLSYLNK